MSYDPSLPHDHAEVVAAELRGQFNGLKTLIDAIPPGQVGPPGPAGRDGNDGATGPQGPAGADGRSVVGVNDNGSGQAIIVMSDGSTYGPFTVASGPQGPQGEQGPQGSQGEQGPQGNEGRYVTGVYDNGMGQAYIQMSDGSTYGPFTVASGPQGPQGNDGPQGPQGEVSYNDMNNAISMALGGTSNNTNGVAQLSTAPSDPPTASDLQAVIDKVNELIAALRR